MFLISRNPSSSFSARSSTMRFDNSSRLILLKSAFVAQKALLSCPIYSGAVSCPRTLCLPLSVCHPHTLPSNDRIWQTLRVLRKYACLLAGPLSSVALQLWLPRRKHSRCLDRCTPCSIHRAQRGACPANSSFLHPGNRVPRTSRACGCCCTNNRLHPGGMPLSGRAVGRLCP